MREVGNHITIYLDADVVEHFRTQAENFKAGYQTLMHQTLREKAPEIIERLLQDKNALSRLKPKLETV